MGHSFLANVTWTLLAGSFCLHGWERYSVKDGRQSCTWLAVCLGQGDVTVPPPRPPCPHALPSHTSPCLKSFNLKAIRVPGRAGELKSAWGFPPCCTQLQPASATLSFLYPTTSLQHPPFSSAGRIGKELVYVEPSIVGPGKKNPKLSLLGDSLYGSMQNWITLMAGAEPSRSV